MLGDGSWKSKKKTKGGRSGTYLSVSKRLIEDVAEIALKCGYGVSFGVRQPTTGKIKGKLPCHYVCISKWNSTSLCGTPEIVDFKGWVSCVQVSSGVIFVERNGKTCWSGNSYVTQNLMTAMGAPKDREEGRMLVVCMELQPNTFFLDEDDINFYISKPLSGNLNENSYYNGMYYLANTLPDAYPTFKDNIEEMRGSFVERMLQSIEFRMNDYKEDGKKMHEGLKARLSELLHGEVFDAALARLAAHAAKSASNYDKATWERQVHEPKVDAEGEWIEAERAKFPTIAEGEAQFRVASEKVTRALRAMAIPREGKFNNTARITTPIGFHGSNRILAIAEVRNGTKWRETAAGGFAKPTHIIVHYGTLPDDFLKQFKARQGDRFVVTKPGEEPPAMPDERDEATKMPDPNGELNGSTEGWKVSRKN